MDPKDQETDISRGEPDQQEEARVDATLGQNQGSDEETDFDFPDEGPQQEVVLAAQIILDHCSLAQNEIERARRGISNPVQETLLGKSLVAEDVIKKAYGEDDETGRDKGNVVYILIPTVILAVIYIQTYFFHIVTSGIVVAGVYYYLIADQEKEDRKDKLAKYVKLRSPISLIAVLGGMVGSMDMIMSDANTGKNPISEELNIIVRTLATPGGYLDIFTLERIQYLVKQVEGMGYMMAHAEITTEDLKELMTTPASAYSSHQETKDGAALLF